MSQTTTRVQPPVVEAVFRYGEPDHSVSAEQRSLFSHHKLVNIHEDRLTLHDFRSDTKLAKGIEGLHKHGFTLVENYIDPRIWGTEDAIRKTYIPSVEQLVKNVTGCKTAIVNNVAFRRKRPDDYDSDKNFYHPAGGEMDRQLAGLLCEEAMISPIDPEQSLEPAHGLHVDYTLKGLLDTIRHCRADMADAGAEAIAALDAGERPARVAAYSIWRSLKTITRDPIAVLNWTSPGGITKDLHAFDHRARGYKGDYLLEAYMISKPERVENHEWFYVSRQEPHEVLMFKFADSESEYDGDVAAACGHGSPFLVGTEAEEARESIEARVLAFW